jgi:hypothetical protein
MFWSKKSINFFGTCSRACFEQREAFDRPKALKNANWCDLPGRSSNNQQK